MATTTQQYQAAEEVLAKIDAVVGDGGIIQASDMARLFPGRPTLHTATTYARAAEALGLELDADGEWYVAADQA